MARRDERRVFTSVSGPARSSAVIACPRCSSALVSILDAEPWCPHCEWGLDQYEPARHEPEFGWRWVDRRTHRAAYDLNRGQFAELAQRTLDRPTHSAARIATVAVSVLFMVGVLALAAVGVWLTFYNFPALTTPFGLAAVGLAVALRPRFGGVDADAEEVSRDRAPTLFRLVDDVASVVGAPAPDIVLVDESFNAYATSVGVRRHRVLCLGLPLWGALSPQERVALLGHELGHFVNGDVRRGLLTQPAFTAFASAADLVRPVETFSGPGPGAVGVFGEMLANAFQAVLARLLFGVHVLLVWVGQRDSQRAEYLADEMACRAGGSAAAAGLFDAFVMSESFEMLVRRDARAGHGPDRWRRSVADAISAGTDGLRLLRQLSIRDDASMFASHPPAGLRHRMVSERPWLSPAVTLTDAQSERIDAELAKDYARAIRNISYEG
jgi:heat shock protein HtpX